MSQVFISHVEEDAATAQELAVGLEQAGYTAWFARLHPLCGSLRLPVEAMAARAAWLVGELTQHDAGSWARLKGNPAIPVVLARLTWRARPDGDIAAGLIRRVG